MFQMVETLYVVRSQVAKCPKVVRIMNHMTIIIYPRDLSYNAIVEVNRFEGEALTALYMDHNLIEKVHDTAFYNLTQLRYL